jgi:hypothetical protein
MASYVPPDDAGGSAGSRRPELQEPIPGWRKPIALVGWGVLIAVLIGLIVWGIIQLIQGPPPPAPVTTPMATTTPTTTTTTQQEHRHDVGRADFQHRHRHAHQQLAVARGVPTPAIGDHAAVATGTTDRDHVAAGPVMRRRT